MKPRSETFRAAGCSLLLALTTTFSSTLLADDHQVGGPAVPGHRRPPLHLNTNPAQSVYYTPAQIRHAYGFDQLAATGAGAKIGIVDAYGNANVQGDLNTFCAQYGLGSTTVQIIGQNTGGNAGWGLETDLDVEWAHVIAPGATIILSVAPSSSDADLLSAVDAAVQAGATVVSMSWGGSEFGGESGYDYHFEKSGVSFTASSGDSGAGVEWPAASSYVTAVGGTTLLLDGNYNRSSETAWSGSGGGVSADIAIPAFQVGWQSKSGRGVPDVSYVADPNTGVVVYDSSYGGGGWWVVGGTSAGAPQWAGLIALVNGLRAQNGAATLGWADPVIYPLAQDGSTYSVNPTYFYDISSGGNGAYQAGAGYDFVTGLGSPVANNLVPGLAPSSQTPGFSLSLTPSTKTVAPGNGASYTVTVTSSGGFAGQVNLAAAFSPTGPTASVPSPVTVLPGVPATATVTVSTPSGTGAGNYTLTVTGTSSGLPSQSAQATLVIASTPATMTVSAIKYSTSGRRNLDIALTVLNNLGTPVANASVSITLDLNGAFYGSGTATTGSNGQVGFVLRNAPSGRYTTVVNSVTASGLTWDGKYPANSYTK